MTARSLLVGIATLAMCFPISAHADMFGSGANSFEIEFVPIGSPGNRADTSGNPSRAGSVPYVYRMGQYEVSEQMIRKANDLGNLGITLDFRGPDKPATSVDWFEAARFVNWLNTSSGHSLAYNFVEVEGRPGSPIQLMFALWEPGDPEYNPTNPFRSRLTRYALPSADEWYKAAFYDPVADTYYDFATGSNFLPTAVASGTTPGTAVLMQLDSTGPADIFNAGGLSPFGTMAQAGNVYEWEETEIDLINDTVDGRRGLRGGDWQLTRSLSSSSAHASLPPNVSIGGVGFRVVAIPEPRSVLISSFSAVIMLFSARRKS